MTAPDVHTLTGAYAANALSPAEREEFEQHLAVCAACTQEVRELQETAAVLGTAVQEEPPDGLRDAVAAEVARTRQLPPQVGGAGADAAATPPRRLPRWVPLVAAALVLAVLALGATTAVLYRQLESAQSTDEQVAAVLDAPDAQAVAATSGEGVGGVVVMSRDRGELVFISSGLEELPANRTYQLWLIEPEGPQSAGLVEASDGRATKLVRSDLGKATAVGLTVEPTGGSRQPTTDPLVVVQMPPA